VSPPPPPPPPPHAVAEKGNAMASAMAAATRTLIDGMFGSFRRGG
jgi:hypothetical protein